MSYEDMMYWDDNRLMIGTRLSGYSIIQDEKYTNMYRVHRPDKSLSGMVNLSRAKDAARVMILRDLRSSAPVK